MTRNKDTTTPACHLVILILIGGILYFEGRRLIASVPLYRPDCSLVPRYSGLLKDPHDTTQSLDSLKGKVERSTSLQKKKDLLKHNVTTQSVISLKAKMDLYYVDNEKKLPGTKNAQARRLLRYLIEEKMVPTLPKVHITKTLGTNYTRMSNAQEKEDVFIYEHFYNEETKKCHRFGSHMFESGALDGIKYANTLMLEQYYYQNQEELTVILVEASHENWEELKVNGPKFRPRAILHNAALCPIGTKSICMQQDERQNNAKSMHKVDRNQAVTTCANPTPCFAFDESIHYSFLSLDIEGFELEFLRLRKPKADILMIEVIQWARNAYELSTVIQLVAYLADIGYYLYEETIGFRNFVFLSQDLVDDCSDSFGLG